MKRFTIEESGISITMECPYLIGDEVYYMLFDTVAKGKVVMIHFTGHVASGSNPYLRTSYEVSGGRGIKVNVDKLFPTKQQLLETL